MSSPPIAETAEKLQVPEVMPLIALPDLVIFPHMVFPLGLQGDARVKAIDTAAVGSKLVGFFWQRTPSDKFDPLTLARTGTATRILRLARTMDGTVQVAFQGLARIQIQQLVHSEPFPYATVK